MNFSYKARDSQGKAVTGVMESPSKDKLAEKLRDLGYFPIQIQEAGTRINWERFSERFKRLKAEDLILFNVQLANMIDAGLTLVHSLDIIGKQVENRKLRGAVEEVKRAVEAGAPFSDALAKHPQIFPPLFIHLVQAGETSGKLNVVLNRLANYVEQQEDMRQRVKNALFYPMILVAVGIVVVILIVSFVMPQFAAIFERANVALPLPTVVFYNAGLFLRNYLVVLIFLAWLGALGVRYYGTTLKGGYRMDRMKLALPVIGPLARKLIICRFSRTLATLVDSGVPILYALEYDSRQTHGCSPRPHIPHRAS